METANAGREWSEMDIIDLRECIKTGDFVAQTATFLRRTIGEVSKKRRSLGCRSAGHKLSPRGAGRNGRTRVRIPIIASDAAPAAAPRDDLPKVRFARNFLLEEAGFELSVPPERKAALDRVRRPSVTRR